MTTRAIYRSTEIAPGALWGRVDATVGESVDVRNPHPRHALWALVPLSESEVA